MIFVDAVSLPTVFLTFCQNIMYDIIAIQSPRDQSDEDISNL